MIHFLMDSSGFFWLILSDDNMTTRLPTQIDSMLRACAPRMLGGLTCDY